MKFTRPACSLPSPAALILLVMLSAAGSQFSCAPAAASSADTRNIPRSQLKGDPLAACASARNRAIVQLSNEARKDAGLQPVFCEPALDKIAQKHADEMCDLGYFSHTSKDWRTMKDRVDEAGFEFRAIGENIAMGQRSPQEVHTGWMGSPTHRQNIERPVFSRLGIGYAPCKGQAVWVQNFAN